MFWIKSGFDLVSRNQKENIPMKWGIFQFPSISSVFGTFIGFFAVKTVLDGG